MDTSRNMLPKCYSAVLHVLQNVLHVLQEYAAKICYSAKLIL